MVRGFLVYVQTADISRMRNVSIPQSIRYVGLMINGLIGMAPINPLMSIRHGPPSSHIESLLSENGHPNSSSSSDTYRAATYPHAVYLLLHLLLMYLLPLIS
jgi:hypothetical protein